MCSHVKQDDSLRPNLEDFGARLWSLDMINMSVFIRVRNVKQNFFRITLMLQANSGHSPFTQGLPGMFRGDTCISVYITSVLNCSHPSWTNDRRTSGLIL